MSSISAAEGAVAPLPSWREKRRRRILAAALEVLRTRPEAGVSMDAIAGHAGVGKATLYRYFDTKELLLRACLQEVIGELGARMEAAEDSAAPAPERLRRILACMVETFSRHLLPLRLVTRHHRELDEAWRWWVQDARQRLVSVLTRHFERGVEAGAYNEVDLALVPHMVMGMIRSGVTHTGVAPEALTERIADFVLRACGGDRGARGA